MGIYEVATDDEDYSKVNADARLKLEEDFYSCYAVHYEGRQSRETSGMYNFHQMPVRNSQIQENTGACGRVKRKHVDHIADIRYVGSLHYGLVHEPVSVQEALKIPEAKAAVDKEWEHK